MKSLGSRLLLLVGLTLVFGALASAQATRTWVSGVGDDANPCSRTAPCKTFAGSIAKTATGGEIDCLDPGGFGAVTITKSMTIDCGFTGGVLVSVGNGIIVNDGGAGNAVVTIKNLSINGLYGGTNGINFISGKTLHVQDVTIHSFTTSCVSFASFGQLTVENSTLSECGPDGLKITTSTNLAYADLHNVRIWNVGTASANTNGINAGTGSRMVIRDSEISFATVGINQAAAAGGSTVAASTCTFGGNGTAVLGVANSGLLVSKSLFYLNGLVFGTATSSTGDNVAFLNTTNGTPGTGSFI